MRLGSQFATVLTESNKLFFKGEISGVMEETTEYQPVPINFAIAQIECGNSHIVILSSKGEVFFLSYYGIFISYVGVYNGKE